MAGARRSHPRRVPGCAACCFVRRWRRRTGTSGRRRTTRLARPPLRPGSPSAPDSPRPWPRSAAGCHHSASQGRIGCGFRRTPCTSSGEYFFDSRTVSQDQLGHPALQAECPHLRPPTGRYPRSSYCDRCGCCPSWYGCDMRISRSPTPLASRFAGSRGGPINHFYGTSSILICWRSKTVSGGFG
jgi:hypothetical protein